MPKLMGKCETYTGAQNIADVRKKIWEDNIGAKPVQCYVVHRCNNKRCVNKYHLKLETNVSNEYMSKRRGRHSRSKLTDKQVKEIKTKYNSGKHNQTELASTYEVSQGTICRILRGEIYKEVLNNA